MEENFLSSEEFDILQKLENLIFGKMSGLNHTYRFSGTIKQRDQSVAEHSYWTAVIAGALANYENFMRKKKQKIVSSLDLKTLYEQALFHDIEEVITGDINHLFKNESGELKFKQELERVTRVVVKREIFDIILNGEIYFENWIKSHEETEHNYLIKMGDWLQLLQYVIEEYNIGNIYFVSTIKRVIKLIKNKNNSEKQKERFFFVPDLIDKYMVKFEEKFEKLS